MRCLRNSLVLVAVCLTVCVVVPGCGLSQEKVDEADARIKELASKGAPDTLLSKAKVFLFNVKGAKRTGNSGQLRKNWDSLTVYLDRAEASFTSNAEQLKPVVDSLARSIAERKAGLTGLHLQTADSLAAVVDSFIKLGWYRQAKDKADELDQLLPSLHEQEAQAAKIRKALPGRWVGEREPGDKRFKATHQQVFTFGADGSLSMSERMNGQTEEYLKEDWQFISSGTWDVVGDTILMLVSKEKCTRQTYWNKKDGKWIRDDKPTYDTTITDGSKNQFMTYEYLKEEFARK